MVLVTRSAAAVLLMLAVTLGGTATVVLAQATPTPPQTIPAPRGCGGLFVPCGPLPFPVPKFPALNLPSPSPLPTVPSATPAPATPTMTPSLSPTPSNTPGGPTPTPTAYWTEVYYDCFMDACRTELAATQTAQPLTLTAVLGSQTPGSVGDLSVLSNSFGRMAETLAAQATMQLDLGGTPSGPAEVADELGAHAGMFFGIARALQSLNSYTFGIVSFLFVALGFVLTIFVLTTIVPMIFSFVKILINLWQAIKPF